jgi:arylsulfatase A-like enzyme
MLTGLFPSQVGVRNNGRGLQDCRRLPVPTLFMRFAEGGWRTIGAGKTHWTVSPDAEKGIPGVVPSTFGLEERFIARMPGGHDSEPGAVYFGDDDQSPSQMAAIREWNREAGSGGEGVTGYLGRTLPGDGWDLREAWLTGKFIDALEKAREDDVSWFGYLSFDAPHAPLYAPAAFEALYDIDTIELPADPPAGLFTHYPNLSHTQAAVDHWRSLPVPEKKRTLLRYYALCSYADAKFGRVLDYLEASGQSKNTLVIFTSDHGESLGDRGRFSKYSLYEASVRVPLILAGAGISTELNGTRASRPAGLIDVVPTLLALTGQEIPKDLPGENLVSPAIRTGSFAEMHGHGGDPVDPPPILLWRTQKWKLILGLPAEAGLRNGLECPATSELYDLEADPGEWRNLSSDPAFQAVYIRLKDELKQYLEQAGYL